MRDEFLFARHWAGNLFRAVQQSYDIEVTSVHSWTGFKILFSWNGYYIESGSLLSHPVSSQFSYRVVYALL